MPAFDVSEWVDMMANTVTIEPWVSNSVSGVPSYSGVLATYKCYIEMKNHLIIDHLGREIMAKGRVFMATTVLPSVKDRLTLPTGYLPQQPYILAVDPFSDETGIHHVTLEIG